MIQGSTIRRRLRAAAELAELSKRIKDWKTMQEQIDTLIPGAPGGRHKSQIAAIAQTSSTAAFSVRRRFDDLPKKPETEQWAELEKLEEAIVWLARFFEFFATKFEQRAGEAKFVLTGADEVLWSCRQSFLANAGTVKKAPPAVPFIGNHTTPIAVAHNATVPAALKIPVELDIDAGLRETIQRFPVPLLQLPSFFIRAPWSLVYIGHEAGHFLIHDLDLTGALEQSRPKELKAPWFEEFVADAMWLLLMGEPALDGLCDELWDTPERMGRSSHSHPPPTLRLRVMIRMARTVGILDDGSAEARTVGLPAQDALEKQIVDTLTSPLYDGRTLPALLRFDPVTTAKRLDWWQERLRKENVPPARDVEAGRFIAAAAYREWARISAAEPLNPGDLEALSRRLLDFLPRVAPEGDRAPASVIVPPNGEALAKMILSSIEKRKGPQG
jgi:hypothetical protein